MSTQRALLLRIVDQGFNRRAWHGPTLGGAIRGVTVRQAVWRPGPRRHCIWELVLHTAYWKYAVRRRLAGEAIGGFARPGNNWIPLPSPLTQAAWRRDLELLRMEHRKLRAAVAALPERSLGAKGGRGIWTNAEMVHGVAMHDIYHAGQIQLLKRLQRARGR